MINFFQENQSLRNLADIITNQQHATVSIRKIVNIVKQSTNVWVSITLSALKGEVQGESAKRNGNIVRVL